MSFNVGDTFSISHVSIHLTHEARVAQDVGAGVDGRLFHTLPSLSLLVHTTCSARCTVNEVAGVLCWLCHSTCLKAVFKQ